MMKRVLCVISLVAQIGLSATVLAAQGSVTVEQVLERMAAAIGGRERLAKIESMNTRFALAVAGLQGSGETLVTADGRTRSTYDIGGIDGALTVYDGKTAWKRDLNGKVRQHSEPELEGDVTQAYSSTFSYLLPGRLPGRAVLVGEDAGKTHYVVRLEPAGGIPVTLYVDKSTYLIDRSEQLADDRTSTTTYSDWREVDGVKFPFRMLQHAGDAANTKYDVTITVSAIELNVPVEDTAFAKPAEGAADFTFAKGSSATGIPIEMTANHIFLQVRINGSRPLWFLFDTGAEATVIAKSTLEELGLDSAGTVEARGNGEGSLDASFVKGVTLGVDGAEVKDQTVYAIPLEGIEPFEGRKIEGIVGYDFTSRFVVEIDYAAKRMNLFDPKTYAYKGAGQRLPIKLVGNVPFVEATILDPGKPALSGLFLVDTGSRSSLSINAPFVQAHDWLRELADRSIAAPYGLGIGGETKATVGRVGAIRLGTYELEKPVTGFSFDKQGAKASSDTAGAIGGEILKRFDVVFDYSRAEMILTPNADFAKPNEYDMLGVLLRLDAPEPTGFYVQRVVEGSAAATAGLAPGDVIVAVDGKPASTYTLESIHDLFRQDGRTMTLGIRRGESTMDVKVRLKKMV